MKAKKLVLLTFVLAFAVNALADTAYSEGWMKGWKEGWRYVHDHNSFMPLPPFPPFPRFDHDDFQPGYDDGFVAAIKGQ
jgi:hypothetical protein